MEVAVFYARKTAGGGADIGVIASEFSAAAGRAGPRFLGLGDDGCGEEYMGCCATSIPWQAILRTHGYEYRQHVYVMEIEHEQYSTDYVITGAYVLQDLREFLED